MENPIKHSRVTYSAMQVDLVKKWLLHFGAIDACKAEVDPNATINVPGANGMSLQG